MPKCRSDIGSTKCNVLTSRGTMCKMCTGGKYTTCWMHRDSAKLKNNVEQLKTKAKKEAAEAKAAKEAGAKAAAEAKAAKEAGAKAAAEAKAAKKAGAKAATETKAAKEAGAKAAAAAAALQAAEAAATAQSPMRVPEKIKQLRAVIASLGKWKKAMTEWIKESEAPNATKKSWRQVTSDKFERRTKYWRKTLEKLEEKNDIIKMSEENVLKVGRRKTARQPFTVEELAWAEEPDDDEDDEEYIPGEKKRKKK